MLMLAAKNLFRRPLRTLLTVIGLATSVGFLGVILSFSEGYQRGLRRELDGMGMQMMLVPLGCPYDAAARVLKGRSLDVSLPQAALTAARSDKAVAVASPIFAATLPRPDRGRTDLWVGIDDATRQMKPWWKLTEGSTFFKGPDSILLGSEAAATELRKPGDRFYSPETGRTFTVCGVLERSGTSDDSQFFVPLATAQAMFHQPGRLTGIAIRLKDPSLLKEASDRLRDVKGAQVVTVTEMLGTFLNLMNSARTLTVAIAFIAVTISALSIFNTMMAATRERSRELGILRAVGFGRVQVFGLITTESVALSVIGGAIGLLSAATAGKLLEPLIRPYLPLAPESALSVMTATSLVQCFGMIFFVGFIAGIVPAIQGSSRPPAAALRGE